VSARLDLVAERRVVTSRDRWFFSGMAVAAALTVFVGFGRTYYLGRFFGAPPLSALVHLHGLVSTSWILLFLTQTSLIAAGRTDLHRRLGAAGGVLAMLVLVVGYLTAIEAARNPDRRPWRRSRSWWGPASTIGAGGRPTSGSCCSPSSPC
jgi:hypothetical protein